MEFNKLLLNMESYLAVEKSAKDTLNAYYKSSTKFKTVVLFGEAPYFLLKIFNKKLVYNSIKINVFDSFLDGHIKTCYGESHDFDNLIKVTSKINDVVEGVFQVEYEFNTEHETRKEKFFLVIAGDNTYKDNYIIASDSVRTEIINLVKKAQKKEKKRKVSKGIYTIGIFKEQFYYIKKQSKDINQAPVISPAKNILEDDLDFFFKNLPIFSCFNQTPNRKILLAGPQGTGKSSLAYTVARNYSNQMPVVFTTDIGSAEFHLRMSAKKSLPTILILEDADATFQQTRDYGGSKILNILDGIDIPHNKAGFYMMMTTNFPEKIEDRIKKRPGRVDKIITVGVLHDVYALQCATSYMSVLMDDANKPVNGETIDTKYLTIFNGLSGAQIKDLITATRIYMAQNQKPKLSIALLQQVKDQIKDSLKSLDEIEKDLNENMDSRKSSFGFNTLIQ